MKNLNFLYDNEDFLSDLRINRERLGKDSVIPEIDIALQKHHIMIKDVFFLKSYLMENKCPDLNQELIRIFYKATYLDDKAGLLEYLLLNNYDKNSLRQMINLELSKDYCEHPSNVIELYKFDLKEILRQLKNRKD